MITLAMLAVFPCAMIYAACSDLVSMTISNRVPLALSAAFLAYAVASGTPVGTVGTHLLVALLGLFVTFGFFAAGWMGGGDAKLIAATVLWFGPTAACAQYLMLSSALGGGLTLALLVLRSQLVPATGIGFVDRLLSRETGVPYGIALGVAGLIVFSNGDWLNVFTVSLQ